VTGTYKQFQVAHHLFMVITHNSLCPSTITPQFAHFQGGFEELDASAV